MFGQKEDQLRLDRSREMRTQRGFDHAENLRRRRVAAWRNSTPDQV
jgi:hypothetical protein